MAANADDRLEIIGFSQPSHNSSGQWQPPPRKHCIAQVTGGLGEIYAKIESGWQSENEDYSKCINEDNFFQPNSKGVLMAGRYQVIRVLGHGNSSTILQAQDTFRPGLYEVAIKVLKPEYYRLGYQESHLIAELNKADIHNFCGVVKLLNTFTMGSFFCMTFELLRPWPLHQVFKKIADKAEKLVLIRKVALRMLQILGFLGQQNVIHADLKPENILCNSENISDGIKVIDFGNAIHGVYEELSLYYDEFELQTLLYRAPEVLLGLPFGQEIDMWSLGCILAELYQGKPLFWAKEKKDLLTQMTSLFGPLPTKVYQRAKFFTHFKESVGQPSSFMDNFSKFGAKLGCIDFKFVSFLQGLLTFDPGERLSVSEAIQHPFMAPEMAVKYVLPFKINGSEASGTYSPVDLTPSMYTHAPAGTQDPRNKHLTSLELLRHGTRDSSSSTIKQKVVHVVAPFEPGKSNAMAESVAVKLEPKSEPCGDGVQHVDEKHEGLELTDAPNEVIKKPVMKPAPVAMKDVGDVIESSSSMDQHPPGPVLREDTYTRSKQSLKTKEKPLKSQQDSQGNTVQNLHHLEGKYGHISKNRELKNSPEDDHSTPHQTLKDTEDLVAKSKSSPSKERTLALDAKSEDIPGNPTDSGPNFSYLNQHRLEAVSHRNKSLGVNMKKLQKSPCNIPERCTSSNPQRIRIRTKGKSKSTPDVRKSESPSDRKGMLICDAKKSVHSKKDVTLLVAKDQKKMMPKATMEGKSENLLEGHCQKSSPSNVEHELVKYSVENTSCRSPIEDTAKHEKRTSEYDFKVTPEKTGQKPRSRKRCLQRTGDSMVKRSKTKRVPSGKVMKNPPMDTHVDRSEMCILEALHSNAHSSEIEQSEARLSSSSKTSRETATLASKISRLQARGDNRTTKQFIPSPPVTPSSSSAQPVSLQSCKTWFLESSPSADQPARTVVTSERSDGAGLSQEHSPRKQNMKHKAKRLPSSPSSPSSSLSSQLLSLQPSSSSLTSHSLTSKFETKSNHHPSKHSSPALRIMQLFSGSSSSSSSSRFPSSVRQQTIASPNVQSQRTDIKATETEPQDQLSEEEEDEVLLL